MTPKEEYGKASIEDKAIEVLQLAQGSIGELDLAWNATRELRADKASIAISKHLQSSLDGGLDLEAGAIVIVRGDAGRP